VLRVPGVAEEDLHVAYWSAHVATALEPESERTQRLLGAAHYRLGQLPEALAALERADLLRRARGRVEVLALLAMTRHRLGDAEGSQKAFVELSALMQIPVILVQHENQALFLEAKAVRELPP
jgi:Flp pilus assembly protein TadD